MITFMLIVFSIVNGLTFSVYSDIQKFCEASEKTEDKKLMLQITQIAELLPGVELFHSKDYTKATFDGTKMIFANNQEVPVHIHPVSCELHTPKKHWRIVTP